MKTNLLKLARKHFRSDMVPAKTNRHNMRAWVRSLKMLGPKWLLATQVQRSL